MDVSVGSQRAARVMPENDMETEMDSYTDGEIALHDSSQQHDLCLGIRAKDQAASPKKSFINRTDTQGMQNLEGLEVKQRKTQRTLFKQSSVETCVDRQTHKVLSPEVEPDLVLNPNVFKSKGSKRKAEDDVIGQLEHGFQHKMIVEEPPVSLENAHAVSETVDLINRINRKVKDENFSVPSKTIIYDKDNFTGLDWTSNSTKRLFDNCNSGNFGKVAKYRDGNGMDRVIKMIDKGIINPNEILVPLKYRFSPHIGQVFAFSYHDTSSYIVQKDEGESLYHLCQFANGKDKKPENLAIPLKYQHNLSEYFKQEENLCYLTHDIVKGLSLLHNDGIKHCDIKPENITMKLSERKDRYVASLIDFGTSQTSSDAPSLHGITPEYLPPDFNKMYWELYQASKQRQQPSSYRGITFKDEIWSVAMVMAFVKYGGHAMIKLIAKMDNYPPGLSQDDRFRVINGIGKLTSCHEHLFQWPEFPKLNRALSRMLHTEENKRCTAKEALALLDDMLDLTPPPVVTKTQDIWKPPVKRMRSEQSMDEDMPPSPGLIARGPVPDQALAQNMMHLKISTQESSRCINAATGGSSQASGYMDIDKKMVKTTQPPASHPVAQLGHEGQHAMEAMRQRKVEPVGQRMATASALSNSGSNCDDDYLDLVNYLASQDKNTGSTLKVEARKVKVEPADFIERVEVESRPREVLMRQDSVIDLIKTQQLANRQSLVFKQPANACVGQQQQPQPHANQILQSQATADQPMIPTTVFSEQQPAAASQRRAVQFIPTTTGHRRVFIRNGNIQQELQPTFPQKMSGTVFKAFPKQTTGHSFLTFKDQPCHSPVIPGNTGQGQMISALAGQGQEIPRSAEDNLPNFDLLG